MSSTCACHDAGVAIHPKLLNDGERVVVTTRTHAKALFGPIVVLLLTAFVTAFLEAQVTANVEDGTLQTVLGVVVGVLAAVALVSWVAKPVLDWLSTSYTFTDRRFIQRSGVISKQGRTIPLNRISGVDFEMGLVDRVFGCGTLVVSDASEQRVPLDDIPRVEQVQKQVAAQLHQGGHGPRGRRDLRPRPRSPFGSIPTVWGIPTEDPGTLKACWKCRMWSSTRRTVGRGAQETRSGCPGRSSTCSTP